MIPAAANFNPVYLSAPGARLRAAVFAGDGPGRGVCVLLNGQTEFIEKYFEVIDELRGRGFTVAALDWRGQGGSGRQVPDAPLRAHIDDFAEYDRDLDAFMEQLVAPLLAGGAPPVALAHSMGGHVLLRYLHDHPGRFRAAVLCAPMLMFTTRGVPRWLVRLVTRWMTGRGLGTSAIWQRDPLTLDFKDQIVTSDRRRFQRTKDFLQTQPHLRLAGPTWGWLAAATRSLARLGQRDYAARITTPVLLCAAGHDRVCVTDDAKRFAARMPRAVYREIAGAEHEILMERDTLRDQLWQAFDAFLAGK